MCWLSGWHQTSPKSTKMGSKILPKSTKLGVKTLYDRSQDASWRGLRRSWVQDGPTRVQERKCNKNLNIFTPLLGAKLEPKSIKNRSWGDPKGDRFFDRFLDRLLKRFGANLAPTWLPKPSQNGAKLGSKSMQVGVLI